MGTVQIGVPELQVKKVGRLCSGECGKSLLQLGAEQCLQILPRLRECFKRCIAQVQLYGGILHRHIDPGTAQGGPARVGRVKTIRLPAEHGGQLGGQTGGAVRSGLPLCEQQKVISAVGAVAGRSAAVRLCKKLLQAAVQAVCGADRLHVLIQGGGILSLAVGGCIQHKDRMLRRGLGFVVEQTAQLTGGLPVGIGRQNG